MTIQIKRGRDLRYLLQELSCDLKSGKSLNALILLSSCYHRASLVVQMVKNPPAIWETWVRSLGLENSLEEGMVTHSSILAWRIPMDFISSPWDGKESDTAERLYITYMCKFFLIFFPIMVYYRMLNIVPCAMK